MGDDRLDVRARDAMQIGCIIGLIIVGLIAINIIAVIVDALAGLFQ